MGAVVDAGLGLLGRFARRRARVGEPVWYLVAAALWLLNRGRRERGAVLWRGRVSAGELLTVALRDPDGARPA